MTKYKITYINAITKKPDTVIINKGDEVEFDSGIDRVNHIENIIDAINVFELAAAKFWGTYETKDSIIKIEVIEE